MPLARLAHQSLNASSGSSPVWAAPFVVVGLLLAWRKPGNPLGWIILSATVFFMLSGDASYYTVADYRLHHGGLPLGWVALLAQPAWAPTIVLLGLTFLLFPDGLPPSPPWRSVLSAYRRYRLAVDRRTVVVTVCAIIGHHTQVDSSENLLLLSGINLAPGWWNVLQIVFFALLALCWVASLAGQAASWRRSSGERREQLKWLYGRVRCGTRELRRSPSRSPAAGHLILHHRRPAPGGSRSRSCIGVAVLKYRLFDIDRVISRTLAYTIVTCLLVWVYAVSCCWPPACCHCLSSVAVAAVDAGVRGTVEPGPPPLQQAVDRRFNRARYDAYTTIASFAAQLRDAVDLDAVRADLLEPCKRPCRRSTHRCVSASATEAASRGMDGLWQFSHCHNSAKLAV